MIFIIYVNIYLKAAIWGTIFDLKKWLEECKEKVKAGKSRKVFKEIEIKFKALDHPGQEYGLVGCYRYMVKKTGYDEL
ncbi:hypothetical protein DB42_BS00040 [Neochlamydia sp. EPS4]|nr:hypothetical protein DB42_BS00040 [Neochlamydia sp. EPS4]